MRKDRLSKTALRYLSAALVLAVLVVAVGVPPAVAQEMSGYFEFDYDPVVFVDGDDNPETDIDGYETFYARLWGRVTCIQDLPEELNGFKTENLRRLRFTLSTTATHDDVGGKVTLNAGHVITTDPLPVEEGDSVVIDERIPLKFPAGRPSGTYDVSMTLTKLEIEVWVQVFGFWRWHWHDLTDEIPPEDRTWPVGEQLTYTAPLNTPPREPDLPSPEHGATGVSLPVTLSVRVRDIDNDPMTVTFFDASDDSVIGTATGVASGSRAEVAWPGLDAGVTCNWYVKAHDGEAAILGPVWSFRTVPEDNDVDGPVVVTTGLPAGVMEEDYEAHLEAAGGTPPYTWEITGGILPGGLGLDGGTGVISGIPGEAGTFEFTVRVTDEGGLTAERALSIVVVGLSASASRTIEPLSIPPGGTVEVTVEFTSLLDDQQWFELVEEIPAGWGFSRVDDGGAALVRERDAIEWVWLNVGAGGTRTVVYTLTAPADAVGAEYPIDGVVKVGGKDANPVLGDDTIYVGLASILDYYRDGYGEPGICDTPSLLAAADDWRDNVVPPGFDEHISTVQLLALADCWREV